MEGSIDTQQYGFIKNFEAKNVWHTAYLVPKNMGNNFHKKDDLAKAISTLI